MLSEEAVAVEGDTWSLLETEPALNRSHHDVICIHPESLASVFLHNLYMWSALTTVSACTNKFMVCVMIGFMNEPSVQCTFRYHLSCDQC